MRNLTGKSRSVFTLVELPVVSRRERKAFTLVELSVVPFDRLRLGSRRKRAAFTLVELLVVIAIIGILVALLLPAIQAAREAARRASCTNNLKNLGIAVLTHHDAMNHFPVNYGAHIPGEASIPQSGVGWILNTLPQLEEQPLYDQFQAAGAFEGGFRDSVCRAPRPDNGLNSLKNGISAPELMKTQIAILQCPSDDSVKLLNTNQWQWRTCAVALTSYKGVVDDTWANEPPFGEGTFSNELPPEYRSGIYTDAPPPGTAQHDCHRDTRCRGFFFRQSFQRPVKIASVTDGTSKTFLIGEDVPEYNRHSAAFYANGSWSSCNAPLNFGIGEDPDTIAEDAWYDAQGFRSKHPGGAHFCLADGSVRFISENVNNIAYRVSCTRDGAEAVSEGL